MRWHSISLIRIAVLTSKAGDSVLRLPTGCSLQMRGESFPYIGRGKPVEIQKAAAVVHVAHVFFGQGPNSIGVSRRVPRAAGKPRTGREGCQMILEVGSSEDLLTAFFKACNSSLDRYRSCLRVEAW